MVPPAYPRASRPAHGVLEIVLRCFIGSMDHWRTTTNELNLTINQEMAAAGITIAFPQRDVHLDTSQPLDIHLHRTPRPGEQT